MKTRRTNRSDTIRFFIVNELGVGVMSVMSGSHTVCLVYKLEAV